MDIAAVQAICEKHKLYLIEDCAQSHFATFKGKKTGTFGVAGTFSFYPGKNLGAYGDAGAIITDDDEFARSARLFANHGSLKKHIHEIEGINSRLDAIQAVVLQAKLKHIGDWNKARNSHALRYNALLGGVAQVQCPKLRPDTLPHLPSLCHQGRAEGRPRRLPQDERGLHGDPLSDGPSADAGLPLSETPTLGLPCRLRVPERDLIAADVSGADRTSRSPSSQIRSKTFIKSGIA